MRKWLSVIAAATVLTAAFLAHPANATMPAAPSGIQTAAKFANPIQTVACVKRKVCSRVTGKCTWRNVCNTPSRTNPTPHT